MSLVIVLLVIGAVVVYVRASRKARQGWLMRLDLPGQWQWEQGDAELTLSGQIHKGEFLRRDKGEELTGSWVIEGDSLLLRGQGYEQVLTIHFFKAGNIGLEDEQGQRRIYVKEATNVVPLKRR